MDIGAGARRLKFILATPQPVMARNAAING
jgi:hypothetical protein